MVIEGCISKQNVTQLLNNLFGNNEGGPGLWRVNRLMLLNAILMGVVVGVGSYAPRYRRHPLIGLLYLGATILLLPIISLVATTIGNSCISCSSFFYGTHITKAICTSTHIILALIWTGVVLIIGINTSPIVAGDAREVRNIDPPTEVLIKAMWLAYLALSTMKTLSKDAYLLDLTPGQILSLGQLFFIIFTKLLFKYSVFYKARRSFGYGRSPRLVAGYMAQLQLPGEYQCTSVTDRQVNDENAVAPPALLVTGEDTSKVEKQPYGYNFKSIDRNRLVTLDKVWQLDLQSSSTARAKDLCFSFALFKLIRCRFAKYTVFEAGFMKAHKFFLHTLIQADDCQRLFGVIADELSFIHDYYYSSLPISYSRWFLPLLSIILSVYSTACCLYLMVLISPRLTNAPGHFQITCILYCSRNDTGAPIILGGIGNVYFDIIPLYLVLAALVLHEIRDIVYYVCSNWTKVALICSYVNRASWQQSPAAQKCIGYVFKHFRCKLLNSWADEMNQCSILVHQQPWGIAVLVRRLFHVPSEKKIMVPSAVKKAVFEALRGLASKQDRLIPEHIGRPNPPISGPLPGHDGQRIGHTMLVWHIATSIFEMAHPEPSDSEDHKIAATHLSRYCTYLVAYCPDLLPDDDKWCKKLYKDVKKDADRIGSEALKATYQQLEELFSADSNHEVLRIGARLGKQLVDSAVGWEELARFWSETILYVAPSENLEGHAEAIARGVELVTLLWAVLAHTGIVGRVDAVAAITSAAAEKV